MLGRSVGVDEVGNNGSLQNFIVDVRCTHTSNIAAGRLLLAGSDNVSNGFLVLSQGRSKPRSSGHLPCAELKKSTVGQGSADEHGCFVITLFKGNGTCQVP